MNSLTTHADRLYYPSFMFLIIFLSVSNQVNNKGVLFIVDVKMSDGVVKQKTTAENSVV
jgi:hypothetical protein